MRIIDWKDFIAGTARESTFDQSPPSDDFVPDWGIAQNTRGGFGAEGGRQGYSAKRNSMGVSHRETPSAEGRLVTSPPFQSNKCVEFSRSENSQGQFDVDKLTRPPFLNIHAGTDTPLALSIGVFDGVHRGHAALLREICRGASVPTVITFTRNPLRVLNPSGYQGDIFSLEQKLAALESLGVAQTVLIDFSGDFSTMGGRDFINALKRNNRVDRIVVGVNFRCGRGLDTGIAEIRGLTGRDGIEICTVEPVMAGAYPVSSSRIRDAVSRGDFAEAAELLGRNVELDTEGLPFHVSFQNGREYLVYDVRASGKVIPPAGKYRGKTGGVETEMFVDNGYFIVPGTSGPDEPGVKRFEFLGP